MTQINMAHWGRGLPGTPRWSGVTFGGTVLLLGITIGALLPFGGSGGLSVDGAPAPQAETRTIPFVVQGVGALHRAASLTAGPSGGDVLAALAPGAPVAIGGVVRVPAGLGLREAYWVRLESADAAYRFGFVPAASVALAGGTPPELDLGGLPARALLAPPEGLFTEPAPAEVAPTSPGTEAAAASRPSTEVASTAVAAIDIPWLPETVRRWAPLLVAAGGKYGVDPNLLAIVTLVESGGDANAGSGVGATGLMQIMPATGASIAADLGRRGYHAADLRDPATNIEFGAYYLSRQLKAFGRADDPDWLASIGLAAAAYNGGPGHVQSHLAGRPLHAETARYQRWVTGMWTERAGASSATYDRWLEAGGRVLVEAARGA